jgi:putative transposase
MVVVHSASVPDRDGGLWVFQRARGSCPRLAVIWADAAYSGIPAAWVANVWGKRLEVVPKPARDGQFHLLSRRWVVERTFAWLGRYRRLSKDYEYLPQTSETMIYVAMIRLMVRRLGQVRAF